MAIGFDRVTELAEEGLPVFLTAGTETEGEYYCAACGYGVAVRRALPRCPMCGGETWESPGTSAFVTR
jgi:rubrerythrin